MATEKHIHFHLGTYDLSARVKPVFPTLFVGGNPYPYNKLNSLQYSSNGSDWNNINSGGFCNTADVVYGSNLWVAVGVGSSPQLTIQYSSDGSNFLNVQSGGFNYNNYFNTYTGRGVAYGNGIFVAVGLADSPKSTIQYSLNGSNWLAINSGGFSFNGTDQGQDVAYGSTLWVAVGTAGSPRSTIQYSSDGSNWLGINSGGFSENYGNGVAYGSNLWVAVGTANSPLSTIQYSSDGSNWSNAITNASQDNYGKQVVYGSNSWLALNDDYYYSSSLQYSTDGKNWVNASSGLYSRPTNISYRTLLSGKKRKTKANYLWSAYDSFKNIMYYSSNGTQWEIQNNNLIGFYDNN